MKMKLVLAGLLIILLNTGSSCINDSILVAVNLPISGTWPIHGGNDPTFSGTATVKLVDQIDASYSDVIQAARYYDIRVSVSGAYTGNVSGSATIQKNINGVVAPLLTFNGRWDDFKTPQSLLGSSPHIVFDQAGIAVLVSALNTLKTDPSTTLYLTANGSVNQTPVPGGLTVTVEILSQVDAQVGSGGSNP